jgi:CRP/FNR family transcriptional regulator, cyclic AMP receptor protein
MSKSTNCEKNGFNHNCGDLIINALLSIESSAHRGPLTVDTIVNDGVIRKLRQGNSLCHRGEPANHLALIINGALEMSQTSRSGRRHVAGYLGSGEFVNAVALLDDEIVLHDVTAQTDVSVLLISKHIFVMLMEADYQFSKTILQFICKRTRQAYDFLANAHLFPLRQRCAKMLLHLAAEFGLSRKDGIDIALKLSQDELAESVGCSRPILNRELKALEREGLIKVSYSQITIVNEGRVVDILKNAQ